MEHAFLKAAAILLRKGSSVIDCYKWVLAKKENFPIKIQALILKVLRSSFYSWVFRRSTTEIGEVSLKRLSGRCGWTLTEVLGLGSHPLLSS